MSLHYVHHVQSDNLTSEKSDSHISKLRYAGAPADMLFKQLLTSSSFMVIDVTLVTRKEDTGMNEEIH